MSTSHKPQYAIIGGGISGLTLAIALHHRGLSVSIYEQAASFGEIGAGVGFTDNAIQAMRICHEGIVKAFQDICTYNQWPSKENVWFDVYDAYREPPEHAFTIMSEIGQAGVHRAHFLDELVKLLPEDKEIAHFGKRFADLKKGSDGQWQIKFEDGSSATADAVIGCDGIKSSVRRWMYGADHPCSTPTYTHKYAYRALVSMEEAVDAVGKEKAMNACLHVRPPYPSSRLACECLLILLYRWGTAVILLRSRSIVAASSTWLPSLRQKRTGSTTTN
jgi:salicylate hydroxylase